MRTIKKSRKARFISSLLFLLTACGGGGGGNNENPDGNDQAVTPVIRAISSSKWSDDLKGELLLKDGYAYGLSDSAIYKLHLLDGEVETVVGNMSTQNELGFGRLDHETQVWPIRPYLSYISFLDDKLFFSSYGYAALTPLRRAGVVGPRFVANRLNREIATVDKLAINSQYVFMDAGDYWDGNKRVLLRAKREKEGSSIEKIFEFRASSGSPVVDVVASEKYIYYLSGDYNGVTIRQLSLNGEESRLVMQLSRYTYSVARTMKFSSGKLFFADNGSVWAFDEVRGEVAQLTGYKEYLQNEINVSGDRLLYSTSALYGGEGEVVYEYNLQTNTERILYQPPSRIGGIWDYYSGFYYHFYCTAGCYLQRYDEGMIAVGDAVQLNDRPVQVFHTEAGIVVTTYSGHILLDEFGQARRRLNTGFGSSSSSLVWGAAAASAYVSLYEANVVEYPLTPFKADISLVDCPECLGDEQASGIVASAVDDRNIYLAYEKKLVKHRPDEDVAITLFSISAERTNSISRFVAFGRYGYVLCAADCMDDDNRVNALYRIDLETGKMKLVFSTNTSNILFTATKNLMIFSYTDSVTGNSWRINSINPADGVSYKELPALTRTNIYGFPQLVGEGTRLVASGLGFYAPPQLEVFNVESWSKVNFVSRLAVGSTSFDPLPAVGVSGDKIYYFQKGLHEVTFKQ